LFAGFLRKHAMKAKRVHVGKTFISYQPSIFVETAVPESFQSLPECEIVSVGKRRDGGTRFWCLKHKADPTAKYGKRATKCRCSHIPPISSEEILALNIDKFGGGIALWGAVPPVYDTTQLPMDRGIHVHARTMADSKKEIDGTFRGVRLLSSRLSSEGILVSELDAIYFMVSSVFGYGVKHIVCSYCGYAHLDRDWFSVRPHRRHLCAGCGKHFRDTEPAIGNPICALRNLWTVKTQPPRRSRRKLNIRQLDFPGGLQVWGSNPALIWTGERVEEEGIHVHAFRENGSPDPDETYGEVTIDGVKLNPTMVRVLMAQSALPSIRNRVVSISCPSCHEDTFSKGEFAFTPDATYNCERCGRVFRSLGRLRKTIANPLLGILARLAEMAPRPPQQHDMGLMPETL